MMKGLVIWKDGHASLEEMKKPEISEYQALVRVTAGALCGTDKEIIYDVLKGFHNYPTVLGHEGVGRVEAVGSKVKNFAVVIKSFFHFWMTGKTSILHGEPLQNMQLLVTLRL